MNPLGFRRPLFSNRERKPEVARSDGAAEGVAGRVYTGTESFEAREFPLRSLTDPSGTPFQPGCVGREVCIDAAR